MGVLLLVINFFFCILCAHCAPERGATSHDADAERGQSEGARKYNTRPLVLCINTYYYYLNINTYFLLSDPVLDTPN